MVFAFVSALIIVAAGGGYPLLSRPVGASYVVLWVAYWLVQAGRPVGEPSEYDRQQRWVYSSGAVIIPFLVVAPPWEYVNFGGPIPRDGPLAWAGLVTFALGILLLGAAMKALGKMYTSYLGIQPGHHLVTSGPYRFVRHPGYLSELMVMFGIGLSLSSLVGLALGVASVALVLYRIGSEEQMLVDEFGDEYRSYMKRTRRLIPSIY